MNVSLRPTLIGVLVLLASLCSAPARAQSSPSPQPGDPTLVARGEYLTRVADCVACHTVRGGRPFAGGLAIALPFGNLYSPNITPDRDTGIGTYSDDEFVRAMQQGIARDGRHLYPAFPYVAYTLMPRADILAIKAYLFSLPPISKLAPVSHLQFPFDQRWGLIFWNAVFNPDRRFQPDSTQSAEWNRGAYLVEGPGHCAQCHSPRNIAMAVDSGQAYAGAIAQGWRAYNITSDKVSGIGGWTDGQLAAYLANGHADQHSSAAGPMGEVVENSGRYMTASDVHAMVTYLRTIKPIRNAPAVTEKVVASPLQAVAGAAGTPGLGERVFASVCSNCHGWDGRGVQDPSATLVGSRTVNDPAGTDLVNVLVEGARVRNGTGAIVYMPPFGAAYSDDQIAAVANFVNQRFGNGTLALTGANVAAIRHPTATSMSPAVIWAAIAGGVVVLLLLLWAAIAILRRSRTTRPRTPVPA